ncbi:hypothetical protein EF405_08205 [Cyclobacteriaceae bacterium YHN15]|nr:hypothetical protein EF405_08205 [Cyclobacteriaceae bacterium YHN15]
MKTMKHIIGKSVLGAALITASFVTFSCSQFSDAYDSDELIAKEALTLPPDSNELIDITARKGNAVTRPVRITLDGIDNADSPGGTFTGSMTHLGKITGIVAPGEIYDVIDNVLKFRTISGEKDIIYAANGDEVWSTGDLTITITSETTSVYTGLITFIGGTGRFEGASGFMEIENGVMEIVGLKTDGVNPIFAYSHVGNGEITY